MGDVGETESTMSDLETLKAMLAKAPGGIYRKWPVSGDVTVGKPIMIRECPDGSSEIRVQRGYSGLFIAFLFDRDGNILDVVASCE